MKISTLIGKYMGLVIRNSKTKFQYDGTTEKGHIFTRSDNKGFIINDETLAFFLKGKKAKADFKISKGTFWLERA